MERTITVTRTTRKTGTVISAEFSTERGVYEHVLAMLRDHTSLSLTLCKDTAELLCDKRFITRQVRYGPFLWTIVRA